VAAKVNRARQYIVAAFANGDSPGTPTFIVNGKYRVKGKNTEDMFRILNQLVVAERGKRGDPSPAPAAVPATDAAATPAQQ
jgi:thiol:disulfide interchange protein DsbA